MAVVDLQEVESPPHDDAEALLRDHQAAALLAVTASTLERWRARGYGPAWIYLSRRAVRYRRADLLDWIASQRRPAGSTT